jgi:hypothetical protein
MGDTQNAITQMQGSEQGMTDEEAHRTIQRAESRHSDTPAGTQQQSEPTKGVLYKYFKERHPEYDAGHWRRLRAFYAGGKKLLHDSELLREIFPKHRDEHTEVYAERVKRAFYTPYAGEIVDHIVSALCAQPVTMTTEGTVDTESEYPEWYDEFYKNVSPAGSKEESLRDLLKESMLTAQQCRTAWVLVDLPDTRNDFGEPPIFGDRKAQEDSGALNAYAVRIEPESVVDWEEDKTGKLEWALLHVVENRREGLTSSREYVTERWTYYDGVGWYEYALRHKKGEAPKDTDVVPLIDEGLHTFGEVPLVRLTLPEGLWTMAKLEGLAREHFNKRSGLSWAELQSLLPELYEFNGPEDTMGGTPVSENQEDPGRATRQPRGQGYVQQRGHQDDARFVGPESAPFAEARKSCDSNRDEMHRVTHQMALSTDNGPAALGRSADSKAQDKAATAVVLLELGKLVRKFAEAIYRLVSIGRKEPFAEEWSAQGMEKFDDVQVDSEVNQALIVEQIQIPSPTFRRRFLFALCKLVLGDDATPEDLDDIESELELNIIDELHNPIDALTAMQEAMGTGEGEDDDDQDDDDDDDDEKPKGEPAGDMKPPTPPSKKKKPMITSGKM